ncbi:riboflavin kinase [Spiroplasma endosymbiont of Crioceris asparagi]|uniref:riboflavin kinase n=1 Tax=Spiroplasma endosymbiont of Crioceris asparagi TaxID=3066286 RepID=UPI0030D5B712
MDKNKLLLENKFDEYVELIGEYFAIEDVVVRGLQIGKTIGYPTINFLIKEELPLQCASFKSDVYYNGQKYIGYSCYWKNQNQQIMFETYIMNFSQDVYGETIKVVPRKFISMNIKAKNLEEVKAKITKDIEKAKEW